MYRFMLIREEIEKHKIRKLDGNIRELENKIRDLDSKKTSQDDLLKELEKRVAGEQSKLKRCKELTTFFSNSILEKSCDMVPITLSEDDNPYVKFKQRLDHDYTDNTLTSFFMALATTQIITLFGKPGTGKTTFVDKTAKALGAKRTIISVQSSWTDRSDLLGYFNPINNTYQSTKFLEALIDANNDWRIFLDKGIQSPLHIICLDEMNLARVEYYFAEFLSLLQLDKDKQNISLLPKFVQDEMEALLPEKLSEEEQKKIKQDIFSGDNEQKKKLLALGRYRDFKLTPNVRFVGTLNNDETTNSLSPKVIDRCYFLKLDDEKDSTDKELPLTDFFPANLFNQEPTEEKMDIFKNENKRFKQYISLMWPLYKKICPKGKKDRFYDYVILAKVLPALRKVQELEEKGDYINKDRFPNAHKEFINKKNKNGNEFIYLGG